MSRVIAKHSRLPRKPAGVEPQPEKAPSTKLARQTTPEERALILTDAKAMLLDGKAAKEIAEKHGVSDRALQVWILGSEDDTLIKAWVDAGQAEADEMLEKIAETSPTAHIQIAKVRELLKRRQWYAEKRDRDRYGDSKMPVLNVAPVLVITTAQLPDQPVVIEGEKPKQLTE